MASNISFGSNIATANMKPAANEAIDSLWGQNVGDFLGALRTRPIPYPFTYRFLDDNPSLTIQGDRNTYGSGTICRINRWAGHNQLNATMLVGGEHRCVAQGGGGNGLNIYGTVRVYAVGNLSTATLCATSYYVSGAAAVTYPYALGTQMLFSVGTNLNMAALCDIGSKVDIRVEFSGSNYNNPGGLLDIHNNSVGLVIDPVSTFQTTWA